MLQPIGQKKNTTKHSQHENVFENMYVKVRNDVQSSASRIIFRNEMQGKPKWSFVDIVQVYSNKTAAIFQANAIVAHHVHV